MALSGLNLNENEKKLIGMNLTSDSWMQFLDTIPISLSEIEASKMISEYVDIDPCNGLEHDLILVCDKDSAGRPMYRRQCQRCFQFVGKFISKAEAIGSKNVESVLRVDWSKIYKVRGEFKGILRDGFYLRKKKEWFSKYDIYLASPEWAAKRLKVFKRANWICEGCGEERATEVHHLTYDHVEREFLFELVALCHGCHDRVSAK